MRAFSVIGAVASASGLFQSTVQCDRHVEMLILQDATTSYATIGDALGDKFDNLVEQINSRMGEVYTSVALFCDKPVPFRGSGEGRGYPGVIDMCYNNDFTLPMSQTAESMKTVYDRIYDLNCMGGDMPESSLEALMYAAMDPKVQWSPADRVYTDDQKRIVKVVVLVTDDHPHYAGDAAAGIEKWNPVPAGQKSAYGHFFDSDFYRFNAIYAGNENNYSRLVELHGLETMTAEESTEYQSLLALLGPAVYDAPIEHPGTFEASSNCKIYEYPTLEVVGNVLNRENVLPVVLLASGGSGSSTSKAICKSRGVNVKTKEDFLNCLTAVYTADLEKAGVKNFVVASYVDAEDLVEKIVDKVDELSRDISCPESTTASPDTVPEAASTDDSEVTTSASGDNTDATGSAADSTDSDGDATGNTDATGSSGDSTGSDSDATATESGNGDETSTTETVVPPVVPGKSSNTAVIAGASGGAVAGAAALGGLLYKKFGASLLGRSTPGDLNVGEQVETPETPVEREAFEEVTTDMFQ